MLYKSFDKYKYPLCDVVGGLFNMAGTLGAADINRKAVEETNKSNEKIAKETNAANVEMTRETNATQMQIQQMANELQISENEKAYQRSTASNQITQLMAAGYSEQQAKQLAAGSVATYQPAAIGAAQMQAPHVDPYTMQAPQVDAAAIGNAAGQFGLGLGQIGSDFAAPDGGSTGAIYASGAINFLNENATEIDELSDHSLNTFQDIENWMKNSGIKKYQDFVESETWKRCKRYLPATRAINSQVGSMFAANHTTSQEFKQRYEDIRAKGLQNRITAVLADVKENGRALEFLNQDLETKRTQYQLDHIGTFMEADLETALNTIAECKLNVKIKGNKLYQAQALSLALQDQKTQLVVSQVLDLQNQIKLHGYNSLNEDQKNMFGILACFDDFGLTDTDWGTALAFCEANKIQVIGPLREFVENLSNIDSSPDEEGFDWSTADPNADWSLLPSTITLDDGNIVSKPVLKGYLPTQLGSYIYDRVNYNLWYKRFVKDAQKKRK